MSARCASKNVRTWRGAAPDRRPTPARRFEAARPLELVQLDTPSGRWLDGRRIAYLIVLLDDSARAILAARAVDADASWHHLAVLAAAGGRSGPPRVVSSDNGAVVRTTRQGGRRFVVSRPQVLAGAAPTQLARALGALGVTRLTHTLGNARAKGKLERWPRCFQERGLADGPAPSTAALDAVLQDWVGRSNARHHHRRLGGVPAARLTGHLPRSGPAGARPLGDICALRQPRKVARDHTISLDGASDPLPRAPNLVAFTVERRGRPGQPVRVWHADRVVAERPHGGPTPPDGLSVDALLRRSLPPLAPKPPRAAGAPTEADERAWKDGGQHRPPQHPRADILPGVPTRSFYFAYYSNAPISSSNRGRRRDPRPLHPRAGRPARRAGSPLDASQASLRHETPKCHAERSKASHAENHEMLRCAQHDKGVVPRFLVGSIWAPGECSGKHLGGIMLDLVIRGGQVVTPHGVGSWDVGIVGERSLAMPALTSEDPEAVQRLFDEY